MRTLKSEKNEYDYSVLVAFALGAMFGIGFGLAFFTEGTRDLGCVSFLVARKAFICDKSNHADI